MSSCFSATNVANYEARHLPEAEMCAFVLQIEGDASKKVRRGPLHHEDIRQPAIPPLLSRTPPFKDASKTQEYFLSKYFSILTYAK